MTVLAGNGAAHGAMHAAATMPAPPPPPPPPHVVIAYYLLEKAQINHYSDEASDDLPFPVSRITAEKARMLTHINYSFQNLNQAGECALEEGTDPQKAAEVFTKLNALKKYNPNLRVLFSLGGWAYTNDDSPTAVRYRDAAATADARQRMATSCVAFMKRYGFDGIDIDWEYPRPQDADNFVALLSEIRRQLNVEEKARKKTPLKYQLTIAGAGGAFNLSRYYLQLPQIAAQVDYINLMSYDLNGAWQKQTDHNAHLFGSKGEALYDNPLRQLSFHPALSAEELQRRFPSPFAMTADAAVQQYLQAGVPANKIVLGLPFYGRAYFAASAVNHGLYQPFTTPAGDNYHGDTTLLYGCDACAKRGDPRSAGYDDIEKLLSGQFGYQRYFSDESKVPWLYNADKKIFVSYDDAQSFRYKSKYLKQQGLAGAMFWHLGQDDAAGTLLRTLHRSLNDAAYCDSDLDLRAGLHYFSGQQKDAAPVACPAR
ncbi:glycoside hydrolase family 18 protein [Undibacterium sp.]|uniref:glycoside hydrolase family 18 protein n=1 Tax=Undibacterium sp. TaxID=1914977 RepID=UPI00374CB614